MWNVHEQYEKKFIEGLNALRERLPLYREPSREQRDLLSDQIWFAVTGGKPHHCADCEPGHDPYGDE
jgi:hypothetical protein